MGNMRSWISYVLVSCFVVVAYMPVHGTPDQDFAFDRFLKLGMQNYTDWLIKNHPDPTPVISHSVNLTGFAYRFNSTGEIKNQVVYNHTYITGAAITAHADPPEFAVTLVLPKYWIIGAYQVEGFVYDKPYTASGKVNLTAYSDHPWLPNPLAQVAVKNFTLTSDGYVDLASGETSVIYVADFEGDFEGLMEHEDAPYIVSELQKVYGEQKNDWLPIDQYLKAYLKELFAQATWAAIITV